MDSPTRLRVFLFFLVLFAIFAILLFVVTTNAALSAILAGLAGTAGSVLKSQMAALQVELNEKIDQTAVLQERTYELRERADELTRRLAGPRFELPPKASERYVRVAIAGLGGTGRTSLIRKISACRLADPRKKTGHARTYSIVRETAYQDRTEVTRIDLEDYRGQNASDLLESIRTAETLAARGARG